MTELKHGKKKSFRDKEVKTVLSLDTFASRLTTKYRLSLFILIRLVHTYCLMDNHSTF